jgi:two-component system chemotaxis sensor kinase CheA
MDPQDEVLGLFIEESREHLDGIEGDLLEIEKRGAQIDLELVNRVFRAMHTIKGGAGFFGLEKVKQLAHVMENILDRVRTGEMVPTPEIVSVLLASSDVLLRMINDVHSSQTTDIEDPLRNLNRILLGESAAVTGAAAVPEISEPFAINHPVDGHPLFTLSNAAIVQAQHAPFGGIYLFLLEFDLIGDIQRKGRTPWDLLSNLHKTLFVIDSLVDVAVVGSLEEPGAEMRIPFFVLCSSPMEGDLVQSFVDLPSSKIHLAVDRLLPPEVLTNPTPRTLSVQAMGTSAAPTSQSSAVQTANTPSNAPLEPLAEASSSAAATPATPAATGGVITAEQSIRVNLDLLDRLMSLAGELVLTRNELLLSTKGNDAEKLNTAATHVDAITSQLQEAIMATRMQTVGIVFSKFRRVVRDLRSKVGKEIRLEMSGEDVDLDRTIVEAIGDPLTHLVRNAIDHGIEKPETRVAAGKTPIGLLRLDARHEAGQVIIEISDDGAGIDPARIKRKALEKGIYSAEELERMSPKEIIRIIFKAGFSTAEQVTDISGRGVGMDVVLQNLSRVGGVIDLESVVGRGSLIRIKLPLTLAIIPSVLVSLDGERFAIPQVNLAELVRIPPAEIRNRIDKIGDVIVLRLRGELLPLIRLKDALEMASSQRAISETGEMVPDRRGNLLDRRAPDEDQDPEVLAKRGKDRRARSRSSTNIVVVSAGDFRYGIVVDELLDSVEIVVKPLGRHFTQLKQYAGATILGDGTTALILDTSGIREKMQIRETQELSHAQTTTELNQESGERHDFLMVENSPEEFFAIPLQLITRIEKFPAKQLQQVGTHLAVEYRNGTLPLLTIEGTTGTAARPESEFLHAVVFRHGVREVGLLTHSISDVRQTDDSIDSTTYQRPGVLGSILLDHRIVLILDLHRIVAHQAPEWATPIVPATEANASRRTILIVEDSPFFQRQMKLTVEEAGYPVLLAADGIEGLGVLREHSDKIALVLTDIEMPRMDGVEMTRQIRMENQWLNLPIVAVTSKAGTEAERLGLSVGIDEYQIKLDRERLIETCNRMTSRGTAHASAAHPH